jgi:hypothetical protein
VRHEKSRHVHGLEVLTHFIEKGLAGGIVESREGFIAEEHFRFKGKSPGKACPLSFVGGKAFFASNAKLDPFDTTI